ncbi:protein LITTLE ZIPPER 1-like [Lycium ferocissimum]|uniref:protein LITTLE ZIPPER 1-like n=1 Tax=Lycium ferocissimum TaxID=112874 RepID=UPI0028165250|nr:protein LITTLE ZIPPER 1-like [Lycium ferocissimum]
MCVNSTEWSASRIHYFSGQKQKPKRSRVQVHRLAWRKKKAEAEKNMELRNLKLYMENMSILEENEKLRKKANLLHQENRALMSEFQNKFSQLDRVSVTLNLIRDRARV